MRFFQHRPEQHASEKWIGMINKPFFLFSMKSSFHNKHFEIRKKVLVEK